ncbi:hypothetical protein L1987_47100 [Smallanthus sonchifolius]|uniref:Uncharacterized protein n=1 Tax=Smallanthus sonchifolius TaxID=185202 RepID=A0ACB9G2J8_9ASTR|nr:hypothetical protein L1987_47100 [Smallanthus sonchifolius]
MAPFSTILYNLQHTMYVSLAQYVYTQPKSEASIAHLVIANLQPPLKPSSCSSSTLLIAGHCSNDSVQVLAALPQSLESVLGFRQNCAKSITVECAIEIGAKSRH